MLPAPWAREATGKVTSDVGLTLCPLLRACPCSTQNRCPYGTYLALQQGVSERSAGGSPAGGRIPLCTCSPHRLCVPLGRRPGCRGQCGQGAPDTPPRLPQPNSLLWPLPSWPSCGPEKLTSSWEWLMEAAMDRPRDMFRVPGGAERADTHGHPQAHPHLGGESGWRPRRGTLGWEG